MKLLTFVIAVMALSLKGYGQSFAEPPFSIVDAVPASTHVEGWSHGSIHANRITIDLSESKVSLMPEQIGSWNVAQQVDGAKPGQIFHYYVEYTGLGVTFGYDLAVMPFGEGDEIKCVFAPLTDPALSSWQRDKSVTPVALPALLSPLTLHSGQAIAISTYPAGKDNAQVVHYVRLTRMEEAHQ